MLAPDGLPARLLSWMAFPLIVFGCPSVAYAAFRATGDLAIASTVGTTTAALGSVAIEWLIPFRDDWRALGADRSRKNTLLNGLYFVSSAISQEGIAKTLITAALVPFFGWLNPQLGLGGWWPHTWPIVVQVVLLLVMSDFLQYVTHRTMHTWEPAWQLHKVHHSLEELNWSAVGRMHPLEHFVASGGRLLPLIATGAGPEVVLVYLIFLNAQGFAVHTNIRFDTLLLNRLMYTPDHHRYHHSQVIAESNNNYAGPLLLWDWAFGTLILPDRHGPAVLGLLDTDPMRHQFTDEPSALRQFAHQFTAPLRYWAGHRPRTTEQAIPSAAESA